MKLPKKVVRKNTRKRKGHKLVTSDACKLAQTGLNFSELCNGLAKFAHINSPMSEIITSEDGMRYLFLALVALNMAVFGYHSFLRKPTESQSVSQARAALIHPVTATDVSSELPPMIGTKK